MADYIVTDRFGDFVFIGDEITDEHGTRGVFEGVDGFDPEGGGMLILVNGRAQYASAWMIDVEEIEDEPDYVFIYVEEEEEEYYDGEAEDAYYEALYGEPYDREYDDIY